MDVQGKECESEGEDYVPSTALSGGQQRIRPARDRVQEAVRIISEAKRPVIVLGRGAKDPQAREAADRLGKRVGALIASTLYAKGTLNDSEWYTGVSGLFSSRAALALFQEADCVIAIGAGMNIRTMGGGYTYPDARIVHVDVQPHVLLGTERGADCYVQGDATETVQEIEAMLAQQGVQRDGFRTAATKNALRGSFRDPGEFEIEPGTVDIREVLTVLDDKLPSSVGLVTGSAHNFSFPVWHMQKPRALQVSVTAFTGVGQVIGNAIGAAVGWKDPVVAVDGDGSALQNIQELDTAGRLGVKLLYFIVNDEAYGAEYHKLRAKGLDGNLSAVPTPDFGALARVFGCRGRQARTIDEVAAGIDEFLAGDGPMVLDVRISRNVISIPYRRLHFGQDV
jgi:thiamine pyrophosphate-dependent acetolactate synthase large subunit-like protein